MSVCLYLYRFDKKIKQKNTTSKINFENLFCFVGHLVISISYELDLKKINSFLIFFHIDAITCSLKDFTKLNIFPSFKLKVTMQQYLQHF